MTLWTTVIDPLSAARAMASTSPPVVVDARVVLTDRAAGREGFRGGHIPGARFVDLETELSGPHTPGAGRHPWPSDDAFAATLARLGITEADQVLVYDDANGALAAARLWFMLKTWGHQRVAVLDGGWSAWRATGLPEEAGDVPDAVENALPGSFDRARLLATDDIPAALSSGNVLLDARAPERFRGDVEPLDRKAGHVPGAINRPFSMNLRDGKMRPPAELRVEFTELLDGHPPQQAIVSCGSGVTACHHLLALEHAGLGGARLYTGSWSGWIEDDARAVATG